MFLKSLIANFPQVLAPLENAESNRPEIVICSSSDYTAVVLLDVMAVTVFSAPTNVPAGELCGCLKMVLMSQAHHSEGLASSFIHMKQ